MPKLRPEERSSVSREGCEREPPAGLLRGIRQLNAGEYWECHETLETLWRQESGTIRYLYQGILLVAVGLLHLERRNHHGARVKLRTGVELLAPFSPSCMRVDVAGLGAAALEVLTALDLGEGGMEAALKLPRPTCRCEPPTGF
ncbi:MAG: DUF309 domain-containing protein [Chloroflexota bacterium]|nr:DUF309 domain-containing protein [Chloroflexota bacterium]